MTMTMVARAFERIGDNAVDIGEQVAFVVEGLYPEFGDRAARLARQQGRAPGPAAPPADGGPSPEDEATGAA
ncbi:unannotated protein [freshwater metagenome]|uniref:Unannotated protein n=1 Tax=freshwater metagenome TaxID=449393 RepID=A0A6J7IP59_9ZZZZ